MDSLIVQLLHPKLFQLNRGLNFPCFLKHSRTNKEEAVGYEMQLMKHLRNAFNVISRRGEQQLKGSERERDVKRYF